MKKLLTSSLAATALMIVSLSAVAATEAADGVDTSLTYNSGILVLAFAGFVALVVVVQLVPAMTSLYTMIKQATEGSRRRAEAKRNSGN